MKKIDEELKKFKKQQEEKKKEKKKIVQNESINLDDEMAKLDAELARIQN